MQGDEEIGIGGIGLLLGGLILVCVLGVIGIGIYSTLPETPSAPSTEAPAPKGEAMARIYFEINSAELPAEAGGAIETIKERAMVVANLNVLISGYHDPSGDPAQNAELAKQRAEAARDALIAAGVPAERIILRKPEVIAGNEDLQEARRVDLRLQ
ncbi:OmpA family protein [Uliginosibacterium sp. 31-16]|uniref:OmpA family protein n=1 Tax=Uliginosibacterium sp. 31-16 TaxID=3068315 RepID=UPI00273ED8E3|nr:OmpA family protein [Uliginosibacterium sp. 31-16]MDP5240408.1 OmpA family protein [Uliginosibacterium sp. 31-16]